MAEAEEFLQEESVLPHYMEPKAARRVGRLLRIKLRLAALLPRGEQS